MTRFALSPLIALVLLTVPGLGAAQAQTVRRPDVGGPVREYQTQPAPNTTRPPRDAVTGVGGTQGGVRYPRFIVEALNFKAVDETGVDALGDDEILPLFSSGDNRMAARVVSVGSNDVVQFSARQSCIWPAVDDSAPYNHAWACAPQGGRGPVRFGIVLYEVDVDLAYELNVLFTGNFQICSGSDLHDELSCHEARTVVFQRDFAFETSEILQHLDPSCRCWTQTWAYTRAPSGLIPTWPNLGNRRPSGSSRYEVTFRIRRVDTDGESPGVDRNAETGGGAVHRSGSLTAALNQMFEFDAGSIVGSGGDFRFVGAGGNAFALQPNGGAKIWVGGATARGYATCYAQRLSANYVTNAVTVPPNGQYACYVTSDGRVGELRITTLSPGMFGMGATLALTYTTWQ